MPDSISFTRRAQTLLHRVDARAYARNEPSTVDDLVEELRLGPWQTPVSRQAWERALRSPAAGPNLLRLFETAATSAQTHGRDVVDVEDLIAALPQAHSDLPDWAAAPAPTGQATADVPEDVAQRLHLHVLTDRQTEVVAWAYGLTDGHRRHLRDVAVLTGLSREAVRQVLREAERAVGVAMLAAATGEPR